MNGYYNITMERNRLLGYFCVTEVDERTEQSTNGMISGSSDSSLESSSSESSIDSLPHIPVHSVKRDITED